MSYNISQSARFQPLRCLPLHFLLQFCAIVVLCPPLSTRCAAIFPRRLDDSSRARSHLPFFRAVGSGCTAMRLDSKPRLLAAAEFRGTLHCFRRIMHCSSYSTCALSALTYAIMAPYIAFTTYLCLIYGVKFSPTQAALWITRVGRYSTGTVRNTCSSTVPEDFAGTGVAVTVPQVFVLSLNKVY